MPQKWRDSPEKVQIHTTLLGGGFGRRANPASDFVVEAVQVAKAAKAPVKVVWTREDDLKGGWYRPMWHDRSRRASMRKASPGVDAHDCWPVHHGRHPVRGIHQNGIDGASVEGAADLIYGFPICRWICTVRKLAFRCNGGVR